jgi:pimeloyl-ACP methyl ester carboxylesterase
MPPALFAGGVTLDVWPDAGHFLHLEHPARTADRLAGWLLRAS